MGQIRKEGITLDKFGENLSVFAVNRDDVKDFVKGLPEKCAINPVTLEYELQILKIISVGWALSFYMPESDPDKKPLTHIFWNHIRGISKNISDLTNLTTGNKIDYFEILKTRLDTYVKALSDNRDADTGAASIIGLTFAEKCNCSDNAIAVLNGAKMFTITIGSVKEYLNAVDIEKNQEVKNEN